MTYDILITNSTILPLAAELPELVQPGYLAVKDGRIAAVGPMSKLADPANARTIIDGSGQLVMPGLVNTHTHAPMTLFRGMADDLPLMTWLHEHIFPAEARSVNPEMAYWCAKLAAAEMILSGTTTAADGYFLEDSVAEAFLAAGLRSVPAQGIIDFPAPGVPDPARNVEAAAEFLERWQERNELVTPALFCHSPYTCSARTLERAKQLARDRKTKLFIHLAETRAEVAQVQEQHATTPGRYLQALGILDSDTVCVHCVWVEREEIAILAQSGAGVSTCPQSNMKLGSGIAPVREMLAAGVAVGLGTDGPASNNSLDMFSEMNMWAKLHKVKDLDPTVLPAATVLQLATSGGAGVLGLPDVGSLAAGKAADLIMLDLEQPHLQPFYNSGLLVYGAIGSDVHTAVIGGRLVMQDRRILSFEVREVMAKVRALAEKL